MWMGQMMLHLGRNAWLRERTMRAMQSRPDIFSRMLAIHVGRGTAGNVVAAGAQLSWGFLS
jgi:hypothetical protein